MMKTSDSVVIVREDVCRDVVNDWDAFVAVEGVFAAMAAGDAVNFPVVRERLAMLMRFMVLNRALTGLAWRLA